MEQKTVSEKPIIFSGDSPCKILDGYKTMTRRVITIPRWGDPEDEIELYGNDKPHVTCKHTGCNAEIHCPYDAEELWVRESCVILSYLKDTGPWATFKDGSQKTESGNYSEFSIPPKANWWKAQGYKLTPSIFMPRWASRIQLKVKNIRVERVQDIPTEEIVLEGLELKTPTVLVNHFAQLWDSINKKKGFGWAKNPLVWVVEFEVKQ